MNKRSFFLSLYLLSFLCACREDKGEQQLLDSIEQTWQLCETSLPEAQARAESLRDSVGMSSEHVRQKYDLLTIRLRDKSYITPSSPDSALRTMAYFEGRDNDVDKERACYYLGSAYRDLKDYPRAVGFFLNTVDAASQCQCADTLIWQNALSQLRNLYMLQLDYEEELNAALQVEELARQSGKNRVFHLTDVATAYEHLDDTLHCLQYLGQSYRLIQKEQFPQKYRNVLAYMLAMYSKYQYYEKVDTLLQHLTLLPEGQRPHNYELSLAMSYENSHQTDSAIHYYKRYYDKEPSLSGRYEASAGLQRCYRQKGDLGQAVEWGCRQYDTNDTIIAQRAFVETQRARDTYSYYRDKEKEQAIMLRDMYILYTSIIAVLALLSSFFGLLAFYYFRKKKFMEEIIGKDKELEQKTMINRELTRIALMNNATGNAKDVVSLFQKAAVGQAKVDEEAWRDLMGAIETLYPGFHEAVQAQFRGGLREPLLRTICLMKIGMNLTQISQVMDAKIQTVWNRIKRAEATCGDALRLSDASRLNDK